MSRDYDGLLDAPAMHDLETRIEFLLAEGRTL
jgi:hypothetical protein